MKRKEKKEATGMLGRYHMRLFATGFMLAIKLYNPDVSDEELWKEYVWECEKAWKSCLK